MKKATGRMLANNIELLKAMHQVVSWMNHEDAYNWWIMTVHDGANEDDFEFIGADPEEMQHVCKVFRRIVGRFGKDGWCTYVPGEGPCKAFGEESNDDVE